MKKMDLNSKSETSKVDWTKVLDIVIKILTIGFYHIKKHQGGKQANGSPV